MEFELTKAVSIIERTPHVLNTLLHGLPDDWVHNNEGDGTWAVFDVVGHLIVCELTDFIPRTRIMLSNKKDKTLLPIDMQAHFKRNEGKSINTLLAEFEQLRKENIKELLQLDLTRSDLLKTGIHPKIGKLTVSELLATWVAHDLGHICQITRVMAKQYRTEVGPFIEFVGILK